MFGKLPQFTLLETNSSPQNRPSQMEWLIFRALIFRGEKCYFEGGRPWKFLHIMRVYPWSFKMVMFALNLQYIFSSSALKPWKKATKNSSKETTFSRKLGQVILVPYTHELPKKDCSPILWNHQWHSQNLSITRQTIFLGESLGNDPRCLLLCLFLFLLFLLFLRPKETKIFEKFQQTPDIVVCDIVVGPKNNFLGDKGNSIHGWRGRKPWVPIFFLT